MTENPIDWRVIRAAPELLKALIELEANADTGRHPQSAIDQARAAIAKAKGEKE
jgi:hypothetical protein